MTDLPKVCIVGAGAVGGFLAARLADGHARVSVLARGRTLDAIRNRGLILESGGERLVVKVEASADASDLGLQDIVFVAVKSPALAEVAPLVRSLMGPATLVVPALNGIPWWFSLASGGSGDQERVHCVDPDGIIAKSIPSANTAGAVIYPAISSPEPGVSRLVSGSRLVFGEIIGGASERVAALVELLSRAGYDAKQSGDIRAEVWQKLLGNACFNPVSLLTGSSTDKLIDDPLVYSLFQAMMTETLAVGAAIGIALAIKPAERIALTRKLGYVKTSMLYDVEAGRVVELEAILGALIEIAHQRGVSVPTCDTVYTLARMRAYILGLLPPARG